MALIRCKNCGNMISDKANACPKCGEPNISISSNPKEGVVTKIDKKVNPDHLMNPESNHIPPGNDNYYQSDLNPNPKPSNKIRYIVMAILIIIIAGVIGYYFYKQHQLDQKARLEAERREQLLLDSIEAVKLEAARLESIRQDSIFKAIVPKMSYFVNNKNGYPLYNDVKQINEKLKSLGYSSKESKSYIEGYYDEVIGEYNEPRYAYNYVWTLESPISVNIVAEEIEQFPFMKMTISDNKALQEFIQSLSAAGFRKGGSNAMEPFQGGEVYTHPKSEYWALCQVEVVGNTVYFNYHWTY